MSRPVESKHSFNPMKALQSFFHPKDAAAPEPVPAPRLEVDKWKSGLNPGDPRDLRYIELCMQDQGRTNGCGTTSLAVNLSFLSGKPRSFTRAQIDHEIRRGDMFTSPANLVEFAQDHGFRAKAVKNGSLDQLKDYVAKGVPVQVLYEPGEGDDFQLHYINIVGYDAQTDEFLIADPNDGPTDMCRFDNLRRMKADEFEKRWSDLHVGHVGTGLSKVMMVYLPEENTPIRGTDGRVRQSKDIALPEGDGLGAGGFIADLIGDTVNVAAKTWEKTQDVAKGAWHALTSL